MVKSGLIVGVVMLLLALGVSLISPFCSVCMAVLLGLGAGYLANVFDKPVDTQGVIARGAGAGAIAGALAIIGQVIAGLINSTLVSADVMNDLLGQNFLTQESLRLYQLGGAFCIGLLNIALMAGMGAAGALIWKQFQGQNTTPVPPAYPQQ